jgi:hypothetical protein
MLEDAIHRGMWGAYVAFFPSVVLELLSARGEPLRTPDELDEVLRRRQEQE